MLTAWCMYSLDKINRNSNKSKIRTLGIFSEAQKAIEMTALGHESNPGQRIFISELILSLMRIFFFFEEYTLMNETKKKKNYKTKPLFY